MYEMKEYFFHNYQYMFVASPLRRFAASPLRRFAASQCTVSTS
jgi:hypothetical protein